MVIYDKEWAALASILSTGDMAAFWSAYADYLARMGVYSTARQILYKAACLTAEQLREAK